MYMIQLCRLQSQDTIFYCNETKRNICPWMLQKLNLWIGKSQRGGVSGRTWCLSMHTHTHMWAELGLAKTCSPLWWAGTIQPGETWCLSQSGSGQLLDPDRGSLSIDNARCPCKDISPSFFSWRGICKQILA